MPALVLDSGISPGSIHVGSLRGCLNSMISQMSLSWGRWLIISLVWSIILGRRASLGLPQHLDFFSHISQSLFERGSVISGSVIKPVPTIVSVLVVVSVLVTSIIPDEPRVIPVTLVLASLASIAKLSWLLMVSRGWSSLILQMGDPLTGIGVVSLTGWALLADRGLARVKSTPSGPMILTVAEVAGVPGDCLQAFPRVGSSSSFEIGGLGQSRINLLRGMLILSLVASWTWIRVMSLVLVLGIKTIKGLSSLR